MIFLISLYRYLYLSLASLIGYGWAIVALSFICSALMLPLMRAVAGIVNREKEYESVIDPQIAAIKRTYSSDMDRHFHIQSLYARYAYSPLAPIKKVLPLFVQIPFLLLTYYMLKDTAELSGVSFLFLSNLGTPDALIPLTYHLSLIPYSSLNLLPLAMTFINILTVYSTPGFLKKDRTQAIAISLLFLVLLYTAPSALLLYWTLNNTITFVRTLCEKRFAGAHLLASRLAAIPHYLNPHLYLRWLTTRPQSFWAFITLALIVLSIYFCFASKYMMGVINGITLNVMYRGMTFVVALAAVSSFILLIREKLTRRLVLILSTLSIVAFAAYFAALFVLSRTLFMKFMERVNLFDAVSVLLSVWALPYVFQKEIAFFRHSGKDIIQALKESSRLLLFPIIFAVHYAYSSAVFILPPISLVLLCVYLLALPLALGLILVLLFRRWIAVGVIVKISFGVCIAIFIMPMLSYGSGMLSYENNIVVRLALMVAIPLLMMKFVKRTPTIVFSVLLLLITIVNAFMHHGSDIASKGKTDTSYDVRMRQVIGDAHCVKSNNVYLIIYDSYAHQSVMDGLKLQGHETYDLLRKNGFTIYDAYSMAGDTISSMSRVFELGGVSGGSACATIAGDNVFSDFLRASGYKTSYLLCGYTMPNRGERMPGDFYFPRAADITRPELVLFPCIMRGSLSQSPQVFNTYTHDEWLKEFDSVVSNFTGSGNFVYAHSSFPEHANWFPRDRKSDEDEQSAYRERLVVANKEIAENINIAIRDPNAIVIFASDHGPSMLIPQPYGNWDTRHLADHFGVLLAIRWPKDYQPCLKLNCLQNVMLEVMIYLSGDTSLSRLENEGSTIALEYPILVPAGAIKRGIIQIGPEKGRSLTSAASVVFEKHKAKWPPTQ